MARLLREVDDVWVSVSATTRKPREGEVEGKNYFFHSRESFQAMIDAGELLEWAEYAGNYYGTPKAKVLEHMAQGEQVVLEIEVQGAALVKKAIPEAHMVFVDPPSLEELERRLRNRGTDSEEAIEKRLKTAIVELSRKSEYDYVIVNDDLDTAVAELVAYVNEQAETSEVTAV